MDHCKQRILFLCTGNSCRSQMAEGLLRELAGDRYESLSAGSRPSGEVHPLAVAAMREIDINISAQRSKSIDDFLPPGGQTPDVVVSVCESAARECPTFPASVEHISLPFDDPAHAIGSDEEKLAVFRRVRDEIKLAIEQRFGPQQSPQPSGPV